MIESNHLLQQLGFGEKVPGSCLEPTLSQKVHSAVMLILLGLTIVSLVSITGTLIGLPIAFGLSSMIIIGYSAAGGAAAGVLGLGLLSIPLIKALRKTLPEGLCNQINDSNTPKLGEYTKNDILVTEHGKESAEWKLKLIAEAEQSILLSGNYCGGKLFRQALEIIEKSLKTKPNLKAHIICTDITLETEDRVILEKLSKEYPNRFHYLETDTKIEFCPTFRCLENHVKLLVVDDNFFIIGGTGFQENLGSTIGDNSEEGKNAPTPTKIFYSHQYRDHDFVGQGPLAKTLVIEFKKLWTVWSYQMSQPNNNNIDLINTDLPTANIKDWEFALEYGKVVKEVEATALISDPEKPNAITQEHIQKIQSATESVLAANLTFNSCDELHEAFIDAASKGKQVDLITNGYKNGEFQKFFTRNHHPHYLPLMLGRKISSTDTKETLKLEKDHSKIAAKVHEIAIPNVMLHKKTTVVDEEYVISGSYNYGMRSHGYNQVGGDHEITLSMKSKALGERVNKKLKDDIKLCSEVSFEEAYQYYSNGFSHWLSKYLAPILT